MNGWTDGQKDRRTDRHMDGWVDRRTNGHTDRQTNIWMFTLRVPTRHGKNPFLFEKMNVLIMRHFFQRVTLLIDRRHHNQLDNTQPNDTQHNRTKSGQI